MNTKNYLSKSLLRPDDANDDSQVEIVDPEVQLFDGADGGEEQQPLEGRLQGSDSDEIVEEDSECNEQIDQ